MVWSGRHFTFGRVCPHEFVSLIFILNMIRSGPGVTFSDYSVYPTRNSYYSMMTTIR